jgi:GNAT superfamily N-acetyltransferase
MALTVRPATPADAAIVVEFNRLLALETEDKVLDPAVLARGVAAGLADPHKGHYFVAEDPDVGDGVLGQIMLTFEWSDWRNGWLWWIQSVYVRRDARRRGVFRALYRHVYDAARDDPTVIGLRLYMEHNNDTARQTYLRLGMEPTDYVLLQRYPL